MSRPPLDRVPAVEGLLFKPELLHSVYQEGKYLSSDGCVC